MSFILPCVKYYIGVAERYIAGPLFLNLMTKLIHLPDVKAVAVRAFLPVNLRGAAVKIALCYMSKACSDSLHAGSEARLAVICDVSAAEYGFVPATMSVQNLVDQEKCKLVVD